LRGVALLVCVFLVSLSRSLAAAQLVEDVDTQEGFSSDIHRSLLMSKKPEKEMIKYCSIAKNRKKKVIPCNFEKLIVTNTFLQAFLKHETRIFT
jgi:nitrate reductase beta subunit